jgi:hypothetical protein
MRTRPMAQTYTDVSISRDPTLRRETLSRGRPRSEESEEAIFSTTTQLLSEKPLRDISMEEEGHPCCPRMEN